MKKELLSEEISQMKYLFNYKKGVVLSEQVTEPTDMPSFTSDELKSQNEIMKQKIDAKYKESMGIRKDNLKSMVDNKKENVVSFIDDKKEAIKSFIGKARDIIHDEAVDVKEFAQKALNYSSDIISTINDKVQDVKTKVGSDIEDTKVKYQREQGDKLNKKYAELEQNTEELKKSGRLMTDAQKKKIRDNISKILIAISELLLFLAFEKIQTTGTKPTNN